MNGEFQELLQEIKTFSKQVHEQRHKENLFKFDKIDENQKDIYKILNTRQGFYTYVKWHLGILTTLMLGVLFKVFIL